jgi:redox-sensitive bicupin YhaK (pirin superfamily)
VHRDSIGPQLPIRPNEVNCMTAGRGITHSERLEKARAEGGNLHALQSRSALPESDEETEPSFFHHLEQDMPTHSEGGVWTRLIAGEANGARAKV